MDSHSQFYTDITNDTEEFELDINRLQCLMAVLQGHLDVDRHILNVEFVSPAVMKDLNQQYRNKSTSTDVLSFPQCEWSAPLLCHDTPGHRDTEPVKGGPPNVLGDIVVSLVDAEQNADKLNHGLDREVAFLLIHGLLHLCGHDHIEPEEEAVMLNQQNVLLKTLADPESGAIWERCVWRKELN